jgi:hypothetical protein
VLPRAAALIGLLALLAAPVSLAQPSPLPGPAAGALAVAQPTPWPHQLTVDGATVLVYQPQAVSWPDHATLTARAALSITPAGAPAPVLGTIDVAFHTETSLATRLVSLSDAHLVASHFPSLDTGQAAALQQKVEAVLAGLPPRTVPLDAILPSLQDSAKPAEVALDNTPPEIFHSMGPASLVVFDGDPVLAPVKGISLSYAVNTNWDVFYDSGQGGWYLLNNGIWYGATGATGPYAPTTRLPAGFGALPNDPAWAAARKALPPRAPRPGSAPAVFVSTRPAEIVITAGPPRLTPVPGTVLERVTNTDSVLYLDTSTGRFYLLLSGRWFASAGLDGPWNFATPDLPADFARIPATPATEAIRAAIPGTAEAQEALIQASIPNQATLSRKAAAPVVAYAGAPHFEPIGTTGVAYATNSAQQVLEVGGAYYLCTQGAWFVGPSPTGPWSLAASVPPAIYAIPPSAPVYNVTYVKVYGATPEAVTFGYTAGYVLGFATAGVMVYGTGYYYPPVVVPGPVPAYLPYPYSYAGGVAYNPATGAWARGGAYYNPTTGAYARGGAVYGPNGGAGAWSRYNPTTGTYAHGAAAWGPGGGTAEASAYNPRTGVSASTTQNANAYGRWGSSVVSGPNQTVHTESGSNARGSAGAFTSTTGAQGAAVHGAGGNNAAAVKGEGGNVYAGADGNVYKHTDSGWSKYDNGSWNQVEKPTAPPSSHPPGAAPTATPTRSPAATPTYRPPGGTQPHAAPQSGGYAQLDQDRTAREQGYARQQQYMRGGAQGGGWDRGGWNHGAAAGGFEGRGGFRR